MPSKPISQAPDEDGRPFRYRTIAWWGLFDRNSPGSRYYRRRALEGLLLVLAGVIFTPATRSLLGAEAAAYVPAVLGLAAVGWILRGFLGYLRFLDEMQRQLQYEAMAIAYAVVMAAVIGLGIVRTSFPFEFEPLLVVLAEPVRGVALAWVSRRRA